MKFTKEKAYKELVAKMTANGETLGLSERTVNEQLDTLIPALANDETELDAFVTQVLPIFQSANNNVRHDISAGIKDYKDKNPIQKPTATPPVETPTPSGNAELDSLKEELAGLRAIVTANQQEQKVEVIRKSILGKLKEKGVADENWANDMLAQISIDENTDAEEKATSLLGFYNKHKSNVEDAPTPLTPETKTSEKHMQDVLKEAAAIAKSSRLEE